MTVEAVDLGDLEKLCILVGSKPHKVQKVTVVPYKFAPIEYVFNVIR